MYELHARCVSGDCTRMRVPRRGREIGGGSFGRHVEIPVVIQAELEASVSFI